MADRRTVVVFGVDNSLGAAVARALLRCGLFQVRVAALDPESEPCTQLQSQGAEVVACPLGDAASAARATSGAWGCFLLTQTDYDDPDTVQNEIRNGQMVVQACTSAAVQHVLFCTEIHTQRVHGIQARHLVAKAEIEDALKAARLPLTCLMVPVRFQQLLQQLRPFPAATPGAFEFAIPMGTTPLALIDEDDVGAVAVCVFQDPKRYLQKTLSLAGDKLTIREIAAILTRHLKPCTFKDKQVTVNEYRQSGLPWAVDWASMFYFFQRVDQRYSIDLTRQIIPDVRSLDSWVASNRALVQQCL